MTKTNKVSVVTKAEKEYGRAVGMGSVTNPSSGGGQDYGSIANSAASSLGASVLPEAGTALAYAQRLDAEREFQNQKLGIIKSAFLEESLAVGAHLGEQSSKEKKNNEIKKANTKALVSTSLSMMQTLMSGSKKNNKVMFEADKAYSVGKAVMSAYSGASKAYETYAAVPPMAALMAGIALARGIAMARSIASQRMTKSVGSRGGGVIGGGGASTGLGRSTAPYSEAGGGEFKGVQNLTVNIHNPLSDENWQKVVEDNIIPALEEAGERNVILKINV